MGTVSGLMMEKTGSTKTSQILFWDPLITSLHSWNSATSGTPFKNHRPSSLCPQRQHHSANFHTAKRTRNPTIWNHKVWEMSGARVRPRNVCKDNLGDKHHVWATCTSPGSTCSVDEHHTWAAYTSHSSICIVEHL